MKHLIFCREYPPAPGGGIGTYSSHISQLLAESGETVHVIGQRWRGAEREVEEKCNGKLIIHRVPFQSWASLIGRKTMRLPKSKIIMGLHNSSFPVQSFSWQACLLAENLVKDEGIDIIEAPEYEAPLYYFQIRRALGLGPKNHPPCLIHIHSPTELIVRHDDFDLGNPYFLTAKRLEDYSISAGDALLCPSKYLSKEIESHYRLKNGTVHVIPYPLGNSSKLVRDENTWRNGAIIYVGRLERRKGVKEWIQAAVQVAYKYPHAKFYFVGKNVLCSNPISSGEYLNSLIPSNLKNRFHFKGEIKQSSLPKFLDQSRIAVVPSRWDNFPYTCIEAMASGLPVIATREGGMAEMIEDSRTGWLVNKSQSDSLIEALERALETTGDNLAEMGDNAYSSINNMCDNQKILDKHLSFRNKIINQESKKSLHLPTSLPWSKKNNFSDSIRNPATQNNPNGIVIVVTCIHKSKAITECLLTIKCQTRRPEALFILDLSSDENQYLENFDIHQQEGWKLIHKNNSSPVSAKNSIIDSILRSELDPLGIVFLDSEDRIEPNFIELCESVLQSCPRVGLVSSWALDRYDNDKIWIKPSPCFPYQWMMNDAGAYSVIRFEALIEVGQFRTIMSNGYEYWDLFNAIMASGWVSVTIPEILVTHKFNDNSAYDHLNQNDMIRMRREILERFPDLIAPDADEILLLSASKSIHLSCTDTSIFHRRLNTLYSMLKHPKTTTFWFIEKIKQNIIQKIV